MGFRYSGFLYGSQLNSYPKIPNKDPIVKFNNPEPNKDAREEYWRSFREIVLRLLESGKNVYLLYPIPELPVNIRNAATPFSIFGQQTMLDLRKSTPSRYYFERNRFILNKLETLSYGRNLHAIKPFQMLCDEDYCPAVINGTALYFDDNHLSVEGAKLLLAGSVIARDMELTKASSGSAEVRGTNAAVSASR